MFKKRKENFHKFLKNIVAKELKNQNFTIFQEPLESPTNQLWWHSYRPDILALRKYENQLHVTLVECETKPNKKRLSKKMDIIQNNLSLQKELYQKTKFTF